MTCRCFGCLLIALGPIIIGFRTYCTKLRELGLVLCGPSGEELDVSRERVQHT